MWWHGRKTNYAVTHIVLLQRCSVLWTVYFVLLCVVQQQQQQQQHDDASRKNGGNCSGAAEIAAIIQQKLCKYGHSYVFVPKRY
jgi:hypothetical protein